MQIKLSFSLDKAKTARRYGLPVKEMPEARYNISPGNTVVGITMESPNLLSALEWGLTLENSVNKKPLYWISKSNFKLKNVKTLLLEKRCIIPADGFYFWKRVSKNSLIPFRVSLKWNLPFAFAGVYKVWSDEKNIIHRSTAILNTPSNDILKPFIKNAPLILPLEKEKVWLNKEMELNEIMELIKPYPAEKLKLFPVSSQIINPDFNSPLLLEAVNYATDQKGNYILFT